MATPSAKQKPLQSQVLVLLGGQDVRRPFRVPCVSNVVFPWEAAYLAQHLRARDAHEIASGSGRPPMRVIMEGLQQSGQLSWVFRLPAPPPLVVMAQDVPWRPCAMWGCNPWPGVPHKGIPWLLATHEFDRYGIRVLRTARQALGVMQAAYGELENYVHADNARAVEFLEWLGFTLDDPAPWGVKGESFRRFWWRRNPVVAKSPG